MRDIRRPQLDLFVQYPKHHLGQELQKISEILDRHPEFSELVHADLCQGAQDCGDNGMTAEQVLRAGILKQHRQFSYEELSFQLQDSTSSRAFLYLGHNEWYKSSCLQSNIKCISEETWDEIHKILLEESIQSGMESGKRVRTDSTVISSHIHHPTDSTLLYDCLRVLRRDFKRVQKLSNKPHWRLPIPIKEVKSLIFKIRNSKNDNERLPHYRKLLRISKKSQASLGDLLMRLEKLVWKQFSSRLEEHFQSLLTLQDFLRKIIEQTDKRVIQGKKVPVGQKIVSIFEPHTDIIVKDHRDTYFGHKVFLSSGQSNLVLDCQVPRGNPSDSDMFIQCIEEVTKNCFRPPLQISADGGFASKDNVKSAKIKRCKGCLFR